jgi:hypothetical protein
VLAAIDVAVLVGDVGPSPSSYVSPVSWSVVRWLMENSLLRLDLRWYKTEHCVRPTLGSPILFFLHSPYKFIKFLVSPSLYTCFLLSCFRLFESSLFLVIHCILRSCHSTLLIMGQLLGLPRSFRPHLCHKLSYCAHICAIQYQSSSPN